MTRLNEKQMTKLQQGILVLFAVSLQLTLYSLSFSRFFPYPLFVSKPEFGGLFLLVYTIIALGSIISGIVLGWRYLPLIVLCLAGTTLALWILIAMLMIFGSILSGIVTGELIKGLRDVFLIILTEEAVPAAIWAMIGGIFGSFLHLLLKQKIGVVNRRSKFLLHISAAVFITIVIFGVASFLWSKFLVFGGPMIFVGIAIGFIVPDNTTMLAGTSQMLLGLVVVSWMISTAHGEGGMLILPTLFIGVPSSILFGVIGTFYGKYLRNHFLAGP